MTEAEFKDRTKQIGLRIIRVVDALPRTRAADVIARQVLRSGTSVGSNYRSACRAQSRKHMLSKLAIVEEEADETLYWLEMVMEAGMMRRNRLERLHAEVESILRMVTASIRTLRRGLNESKIQHPKSKTSKPRA
jgi:four helix bundle protein